ncbi:MAG: helix-turn-helix transcriptional regulator [Bacteroidales bacterium]|nr:helix-turn-helix transcriptional regulator [Bacteroidales bacterium]
MNSNLEHKTTAIVERGSDGKYSIYIDDSHYPYGIIGTGSTVKEAMEDFNEGYREMQDYVESEGGEFIQADFIFKYDIPSFLQEYAYAFTLAGLERITGVNQKQLGHYISGFRKPSSRTVKKIEAGIHAFCDQLNAVSFR